MTSIDGPAEPYLRIIRVSKQFGQFTALDDVSLEIPARAFVCFLGPSGCGKTTLLRAISGLDVQSSGQIIQGGRDISDLPPGQRDFGIVFQSYALFPNLTVARNVGYGLETKKLPRSQIAARVKELLELVGLGDQGPKYPAQLSGGQQQRVALARALATSPGLLLLDEPLSALDARVRVHLRSEIRQLQQRLGVTTIMVTHDQEEALTMADLIVVMNRARIEQVGTPQEVYDKPATPFVAGFVGKMNFLPAEVAGHGRVRLGLGGVELHCSQLNGARAGAPVTCCIRPEDVVVRGVAMNPENVVRAAVQRMEFIGNHFSTALVVDGQGDRPVFADLSINDVRDLGIGVGQTLPVRLPADRLRVFANQPTP